VGLVVDVVELEDVTVVIVAVDWIEWQQIILAVVEHRLVLLK